MTFRGIFLLGFFFFGGVLIALWFLACQDRSAEVSEIVQLLRLEGYEKNNIEPDSQLALLVLKRKELAKKLLEAGKLYDKRKKDLSKLQNEMFAAIAKTKQNPKEVRKQFESGKIFSMNEPLGIPYQKWQEVETAAEGLVKINIWIDQQEKNVSLSELTRKVKTLIHDLEERELLNISPEEQKEIDRLLAINTKEPMLTSIDVVESEKLQNLIWEQQEENNFSIKDVNFPSTKGTDRHLLEQYAGMDKHVLETAESSDGDVIKYVIRPKWFLPAFFANLIGLVICCVGFIRSKESKVELIVTNRNLMNVPIKPPVKTREEWDEKREIEQIRAKKEMFGDLLVLFSESEDYHRSVNTVLFDQFKNTRNQLVQIAPLRGDLMEEQTIDAMLKIIKELQQWWKEYSQQNDVRFLQFWRPDSWDRFELAFPNQRITRVLSEFVKV